MIDELAKELGTTSDSLLHAIRRAAGSDHLQVAIQRQGRDVPSESGMMMEWRPTGWSVAIVCGPDREVSGHASGPAVTRYALGTDGESGSITFMGLKGREHEIALPADVVKSLVGA